VIGIRCAGAALVAVGLDFIACGGSSSKPISQQNCHELAATFEVIRREIRPDAPISEQRKGGQDAVELNVRVDALGGCPEEPTLQ
jgi:hypothetical protein